MTVVARVALRERVGLWVPLATLLGVSGLNYAIFLRFARALAPAEFLGFTTATAILMLALAVAEAGSIYAAPPFLRAYRGQKAGRIAGAFVTLSICLFATVALLAGWVWILLARDPVSPAWLVRCVALTAPNILLQSWIVIRVDKPLETLAVLSVIRAMPLLALPPESQFDLILAASLTLTIGLFLIATYRSRALLPPRSSDLRIAVHLVRQFFVVRVFSTIVTASAPLILGALVGSAATAAYLIGDRTRALVASAYQPAVQGLYLVACRRQSGTSQRRIELAIVGLMLSVLTTGVLLFANADRLNDVLFGSRYPAAGSLALFALAGHVSVVTAIGYFLFLIPQGQATVFVRGAIAQGAFFLVALLVLAPHDSIYFPALTAFAAEVLLLVIVWASVVRSWWHAPRVRTA